MSKARHKPVDYAEHLQSDVWRTMRRWKLDAADHRCQLCNSAHNLEVHHRTYENLGEERECDLVVLCEDCHEKYHGRTAPPTLLIADPPPPLSIVPEPEKWGEHATRVAEIHRELQILPAAQHLSLIGELAKIAWARREELQGS